MRRAISLAPFRLSPVDPGGTPVAKPGCLPSCSPSGTAFRPLDGAIRPPSTGRSGASASSASRSPSVLPLFFFERVGPGLGGVVLGELSARAVLLVLHDVVGRSVAGNHVEALLHHIHPFA